MLGNKLLNIRFAKYHIWNNKSEGFPNMVLTTETLNQSVRTEYSEAVNARYTFQPLWVSGTGEFNGGGNLAMDWHPIQGGVEILLVASCCGKRDKLRPDGPLGSCVDFLLVDKLCLSHRDINGSFIFIYCYNASWPRCLLILKITLVQN